MTSTTSRLLLHQRQRPWSLRTILHLITSQQLTCEELARFCHSTAKAGEEIWHLQAFSRLTPWPSLQEAARASDERRQEGRPKSPLDGIPISTKANLAVEDQALTAGSPILGEGCSTNTRIDSVGYNADVVHQLVEDSGAICVGITHMDEFGMGSLGTNIAGNSWPTKNPLAFLSPSSPSDDEEVSLLNILQQSPEEIASLHEECIGNPNATYSTGGSSCGAAASVAHGSSLIALGSDTGGSIRLPAAWCGVVGVKPSYGRLSRHGLVSYASSLDTVGFLTRTVDCASMVMDQLSLAQRPARDSTSHCYSGEEIPPMPSPTDNSMSLDGIKVGIPSAFVVEECPDDVKQAWSQGATALEQAGATLVSIESDVVSPEVIQQSLAAYYVLASAEASSNLARYDGFRYGVAASRGDLPSKDEEGTALQKQYAATRTQGFGEEVIRRVLCGTAVLSSDKFHTHYEAAAKLRALVTRQLHEALTSHVDYLLIPTVVSPPLRLGEETTTIDSTAMFANDIMTVPISLAGLCAVNIPVGAPVGNKLSDEPEVDSIIGLQLVGHRLQEESMWHILKHLENQQGAE